MACKHGRTCWTNMYLFARVHIALDSLVNAWKKSGSSRMTRDRALVGVNSHNVNVLNIRKVTRLATLHYCTVLYCTYSWRWEMHPHPLAPQLRSWAINTATNRYQAISRPKCYKCLRHQLVFQRKLRNTKFVSCTCDYCVLLSRLLLPLLRGVIV